MSRARKTWARVEGKRIEVRKEYNATLLREWESISQSEDAISGMVSVIFRIIDKEAEDRGTMVSVDLSFLDKRSFVAVCEKLRAERYFCCNYGVVKNNDVLISWDRKMANLEC